MEIVNIVVSGTLGQSVDLSKLAVLGGLVRFSTLEKMHGCVITLGSAKMTLYRSGKYNMYGLKSFEEIERRYDMMCGMLSSVYDSSLFSRPVVQNMVIKDSIGYPVDLQMLIEAFIHEGAVYEPEVFPGMTWNTPYGSVNLFRSGKIVYLACKSLEEAEKLKQYAERRIGEVMHGE